MLKIFALFAIGSLGISLASGPLSPSAIPDLPSAITSFGAANVGGNLFVLGGHVGERHEYSQTNQSKGFWKFGVESGSSKWEKLSEIDPLQGTAIVQDNQSFFVVGGMVAKNVPGQPQDLYSKDEIRRFNVGSGTWTDLPKLPHGRSSHDAVLIGQELIVGGGWQLKGEKEKPIFTDSLSWLNLSRGTWETMAQPFRRRGLAMAAIGSKIYFIGGMDAEHKTSLDVDILDWEAKRWSKGPTLPPGPLNGFGYAACTLDGKLYCNGMSGAVYSLTGESWQKVGQLQTPRFFHRLVPLNGATIAAIGGEGKTGHLANVEILVLSAKPEVAEWNQWRGPQADGVSPEIRFSSDWPMEGPAVAWKKTLGKGLSSFSVSAGKVVTLGSKEGKDTIVCFDLRTGADRWQFGYECASTNHPMPIVPYGPASTPTISGGKVFTLSREGDFFCLDFETGKKVWSKHLIKELGGKRPVYGYANSPLVWGNLVFVDVGGSDGSTVALNKDSGEVVWKSGTGEAGYSSPVIAGNTLYLFKGEGLVAYEALSGKELWNIPWKTRDFSNCATPLVSELGIFISSTGAEGSAFYRFEDGKPILAWQKKDLGLLFNSGVVAGGRLYVFNDANRAASELQCLDLKTGTVFWSETSIDKGTFISAGGKLVIFTSKGELVLGQPEEKGLTVLNRAQIMGGKSYVLPVLSGGLLLCRNNDGEAVCLNLRSDNTQRTQK